MFTLYYMYFQTKTEDDFMKNVLFTVLAEMSSWAALTWHLRDEDSLLDKIYI